MLSAKDMNKLSIVEIDAFVFDFDGVLTNNLVLLDRDGREWVSCNRSDGIAFDVFRKLKLPSFILSSEANPVVLARANKLQIEAIAGVSDKRTALMKLVESNGFDIARIFYIGNDLNDYQAIKICGYSACPADAHELIKKSVDFVLSASGGQGVAREIIEDIFDLNVVEILYSDLIN